MNNSEHAFNPFLAEIQSGQFQVQDASRIENTVTGRELFYQLNQLGCDQRVLSRAHLFLLKQLAHAKGFFSSSSSAPYDNEQLFSLNPPKIASLPAQLLTDQNLKFCIKQTASIQLIQPCWLNKISQIGCAQTETALHLMSLTNQLNRTEQGDDLRHLYRAFIVASGVKLPVMHTYCFSQQVDLCSETFDFAAIQLALAAFPRVFFPEILGFTLAFIQSPTLLEVCFPNDRQGSDFFNIRQQIVDKQLSPLRQTITDYLSLFSKYQELLWQRVQQGFCLYFFQMQCCRNRFCKILEKPVSSKLEIARLFQHKAIAAIGHHKQINLQGVSLDKWFAGLPQNTLEFFQVLKQSGYIDKQNPKQSTLLKLFEFNGPMFGVLDQSEYDILLNWIGQGSEEVITDNVEKTNRFSDTVVSTSVEILTKKYAKLTNRAVYYYLINADLFPDVLPTAKQKVTRLLWYCSLFNKPPFKQYTHDQFNAYIEHIYDQEMNAYQPLHGKPKISRAAYVWGLEQIAPMILIDGCWLQNCLDIQDKYPEISEILCSIYGDELGNGKLEQNHAFIFQQLVDSLSIQFPAAHNAEFIQHSGFINSAFDLPVYMLSLSSYSVEFLPELLGLNMAIELSGLGKNYMSLVDEWNYWGINPTIATIHISIDNYASGHTFLAKKAIQLYMDEILHNSGSQLIMNQHWQRIYNGYASLRFVGGRFKLAMPISYLYQKLTDA